MDPNSKLDPGCRSSTASTSPLNEMDYEPVVDGLSSTAAASAVVPITAKQLMTQTVGGEDTYDVITASPSGSSDGSSSEFVKVEHSDVQQSVGSVGDSVSFKMLQLHNDSDDEKRRRDQGYPVENIMDRGFGSEEPYSEILARAEEFTRSAVEKVSDAAKTDAEKVTDTASKAVSDVKATGETLGDTIHLFSDKLKETAEEAGNMGHQAMETAKDTASNMLSGMVHDISNTAEKVRSVGADVTHSLNEDANKTMHTLKGEFDDVTRQVLDTTHHATDALKNTLQEAEIAGDALKGAAAQTVHSAEDVLADLNHKIKSTMPHTGDLHARTESSGATKPIHEDLIRLTDEINNASEHDAGRRTMFHQPTHGAHKDVDHQSQQWGLDWRQYANEAVGIDARHSDLEADAKAIHSAGNAIYNEIADVHEQVDSMVAKMFTASTPQHDDSSAEESMFDRKGPLTIPHQTTEDIIQLDRGFDSSKQSGFEVSPRPPTPPKELDDEDVKPTTIDLGQTAGRLCAQPVRLEVTLKYDF